MASFLWALVLPCAPLAHHLAMAALETRPGDAPDGHLLYFWHIIHLLNEGEAECCTKQKPGPWGGGLGGGVGWCRLSQPNSYATEVEKKKKQSLGETLKDHFPEAKESWHSAPFNKKEHFTKHMKEYKEKPYSPLCIKTPDHTMCK